MRAVEQSAPQKKGHDNEIAGHVGVIVQTWRECKKHQQCNAGENRPLKPEQIVPSRDDPRIRGRGTHARTSNSGRAATRDQIALCSAWPKKEPPNPNTCR